MSQKKNTKKPAQPAKQAQKKPEEKKKLGYLAIMAASLLVLAGCLALLIWPKDSTSADNGPGLYADIVIKNQGTITVKLEPDHAPITVENFVKLAKSGFYDGLTFHRIIEGFMMQGGDPKGNGSGSADDRIKGEFSSNGVDNPLKHTRGALSMARSNHPDSASCQFFIMHKDRSSLDGQYAVFGYVVDGMDIVDNICESARPQDNNGSIAKDEQPIIETIQIREVK